VGYQQDLLTPDQIDWSGLTHIMMSRVKANADGTLNKDFDIGEPAGSALARKIAQYAHANNTKAILMLGGAENGEAILGAVRDHRVAFIANLVATKTDYGYDGYDLDWEDHIDWNLFETFARELREADPDAVITMPVGCININYETVEPRMVNVTRYVDQVNMMSYYPATAWAGDGWESWYVSPLKGAKSTTPISIEESLARYSAAGVPKCKLGMGIGFFAMGYLGNVTGPNQPTVHDIIVGGDNAYPLSKLFGTGGAYDQESRHWDPYAFEPYLSLQKPDSFGARYVSFEDEQSIIAKGNFTRMNGYGGTIIWTINQGNVRTHSDPHFLMHALRKGFIDPDTPLTVAVSVNPPVTFVVAGTDAQFRTLVTGTDNRNVTWRIQEPDGGMITPRGIYTAPSDAIPNMTTEYHIIATSRADSTKQATAVVSVGDAATLAWDPGLHRMNCAEWWMEVWAEDANLSALELEHNGVLTPMSKWSDYWGKGYPLPNYAANVHVEPGEIIRYHATRTDGRKATTLPIVYSLTADGETLPCPVEPPLAPPTARFTANITHGVPPLTVQFTDTSTGTPTAWNWSFGDTTFSIQQNPVHTYTSAVNFTVSLNATNAGGSNTTTRTNYIAVNIPAPVANFSVNVTSGTMPLTVGFTDQSNGAPTAWAWNFGDRATSTVQHPVHTYAAAGTYTVSLNVTNDGGSNSMMKNAYISVNENPSNRARLILPDVSHYQNTATRTPIRVMNLTNGTGISFNLTYDPSVIQVNAITLNESFASGSSLEVNSTPGLIRLGLTRTEPITIGSPVPLFFLNTTGTGPVGTSTPLIISHAMWGTPKFDSQPMDTVNGSILIYRIRGDLNGNGWVDIGDTAKTAYMVVELTPDLLPDADFNNNGVIDTGDATKIACYLVGKISEL